MSRQTLMLLKNGREALPAMRTNRKAQAATGTLRMKNRADKRTTRTVRSRASTFSQVRKLLRSTRRPRIVDTATAPTPAVAERTPMMCAEKPRLWKNQVA